MNENNNEHSLIKKYFTQDNIKKLIVIAGILGIALIFLSTFTSKKDNSIAPPDAEKAFDTDSYRIELESRLADIISHIDGAGDTGVMITLENGREYIYGKNENISENGETSSEAESKSSSKEFEYITVKLSDGSEEVILLKEIEPRVRGVIVVCRGGDNENVKKNIINAITSIFNISSSRVSVNKMSG